MRAISHLQMMIAMDHASQVGHARREAMAAARDGGLSPEQCERVGLVCTEMASNIVRHAGGAGMVVVRRMTEVPGIEMLALDTGPGFDVGRLMADHQSTGGSLGNGLGAIRRLSDVFDIHVGFERGTAVLSRILGPSGHTPERVGDCVLGVVCLPLHDQPVCGDGWGLASDGHETVLMVLDGLGHGPHAADAARRAEQAFLGSALADPLELIALLDATLMGTRGAVGLVMRVVPARRTASCVGIGNITGRVVDGSLGGKRLVSLPGTLGRRTRRYQALDYDWPEDGLLVVHSDGLSQRWDLQAYPGLAMRHPALVAGVLYRDHGTGNDDTTVAVLGFAPSP